MWWFIYTICSDIIAPFVFFGQWSRSGWCHQSGHCAYNGFHSRRIKPLEYFQHCCLGWSCFVFDCDWWYCGGSSEWVIIWPCTFEIPTVRESGIIPYSSFYRVDYFRFSNGTATDMMIWWGGSRWKVSPMFFLITYMQ